MDKSNDTAIEAILEQLIEYGPDDIAAVFARAFESSGCVTATVRHRPRLLSDKGSSYISHDLAGWLGEGGMDHVRGAPNHPPPSRIPSPKSSDSLRSFAAHPSSCHPDIMAIFSAATIVYEVSGDQRLSIFLLRRCPILGS